MSSPSWRITKFGLPKSGSPTEIAEFKRKNGLAATKKEYAYCLIKEIPTVPDPLTTIGIGILWNLATGGGDGSFGGGNARLGVSDNTTAFDADDDTTLIATGGSNMFMQVIDPDYPVVASPQTAWEATFDGNTANFEWDSFGVDNDIANGAGSSTALYDGSTIGLLNRLVVNQGTKPSGQTWVATMIIVQS